MARRLEKRTVRLRWKRVLLKISGEAFGGAARHGIDPGAVEEIARNAARVHRMGVDLAIVMGGGNIVRGSVFSAKGMNRPTADHMGMLATVINALAMQDAFERLGVATRVMTAIRMEDVAEPYILRRAIRHLEKRRIILLAGGTGRPYFTTDTTAALRAMEISAQVVLKATQVDGIYSADPKKDPRARRFKRLTYMEVLRRRLRVMDSTAISLCMEHALPILVFDLHRPGNLERAVRGERIGTLVEAGA